MNKKHLHVKIFPESFWAIISILNIYSVDIHLDENKCRTYLQAFIPNVSTWAFQETSAKKIPNIFIKNYSKMFYVQQ